MDWRKYMTTYKHGVILIAGLALGACGAQPHTPQTLGDIDVTPRRVPSAAQTASPAAQQVDRTQVKRAYYDFIEGAERDDNLRVHAATRIAELELALGNRLIGDGEPEEQTDAEFTESMQRTIVLLNETLEDFPDAPGNDHRLYQLAKAYDQIGRGDEAVETLEVMVSRYPETRYYVEAKFRIAEHAFANGWYFKAEDAYTDVLNSEDNQNFYQNTLFKRGWARYKQEFYELALDDYYQAMELGGFGPADQLSPGQRTQFDEFLRAIGLVFLYQGGAPAIADYFGSAPDSRPYIYETYNVLAELLLQQERLSDAVDTYRAYADQYPTGPGVVAANLHIITIWKERGFFNQYAQAFEHLYDNFHLNAHFWQTAAGRDSNISQRDAVAQMREHVVLLASHHHNRYLRQGNSADFAAADDWYRRYLEAYSSYARQDSVYPLYAELLNRAEQYQRALEFYELAAFDGEIVLDKDSAYAAVVITARLHRQAQAEQQQTRWRDKHLTYARRYSELYPNDATTPDVVTNAVQMAFRAGLLDETIDLANILPDTASGSARREVGTLRAQAHFDLAQYEDAEFMYQDLLVDAELSQSERNLMADRLALSVYRQGEQAEQDQQIEVAARHYLRVFREVPNSDLAATGMQDAIGLFMDNALWDEAIDYLHLFQQSFPRHAFQNEVSRNLSVAYLNSDRSLEAAREFEKLSDFVDSEDERMAALWQAAQLYYEQEEWPSAVRAFRDYAHTYKRPYPQNVEAMHTLANIYQRTGDHDRRLFWLRRMVQDDRRAPTSVKTERTRYLASGAAFSLALLRLEEFDRIALVHPLTRTLEQKKDAMQEAVRLFGQASAYGHEDYVTEATYHIGQIYLGFAEALLASDRPTELSAEELEQYEFLLEDQAFPFEDKAIEFYQTNMERIAQGLFDDWVRESLAQLAQLYPARYGRSGKLETYVERL